jgi:hypothetical protein
MIAYPGRKFFIFGTAFLRSVAHLLSGLLHYGAQTSALSGAA